MKSAVLEFPTQLPDDEVAPLESVLCTGELKKRPRRRPDYEAENRALAALVQGLADSPRNILQTLADQILEVLHADSAGISLLTSEDGGKRFYWPAIAGLWKPHIGGGTPRDFSPCGDVLDCNAPLLFRHFEERYAYFLPVTPPVEECLVIPFYVEGKAVGTLWAIVHDKRRKFDTEDLRVLQSLSGFASTACQAVQVLDAFEQQDEALQQSQIDLSRRIAELQKANAEARDSRSAALNLMEDAVQSREAIEKLNEDLRESEQRYRALFELGPVAVYSIDRSGVIQNFNRRAAELWGREPVLGDTDEQFCGSFKLFRPDGSFMRHEECPMAGVVSGKIPETHDTEVIIERPDGSRVTVVVNIRPLTNERGEVTGAINCFYDITERKHAEEARQALNDQQASELERLVAERTGELRETIQELESFSYSIAHDMRAPLRAMQGFAGVLLDQYAGQLDAQGQGYLQRIARSSTRLDQLIQDVLNYTKIVRAEVRLEQVDLDRLARDIIDTYPDFQPPRADVQIEGTLASVRANQAWLTQCLSNLLGNAVKFVAPGALPRVRISAEPSDDHVRLWIQDNGIGIAPQHRERIFRLFERILPDGQFQGTGIGLSIARRAVERMGGRIGFESEPGKGTKFWVELEKA